MASRVLSGAPSPTYSSSFNTRSPPNAITSAQHANEVHGWVMPGCQLTPPAAPATSPKLHIFRPGGDSFEAGNTSDPMQESLLYCDCAACVRGTVATTAVPAPTRLSISSP